jgi:four helix bundle protein
MVMSEGLVGAMLRATTSPFFMPFKSYRELKVWQKAVDLAFDVYCLTRTFPREERYGLTAQLRRAALSVSNNIAEGHGRATVGEFLNALSSARGSANERESCLLFSHRLQYATDQEIEPLLKGIDEILRMLTKLRSRLKDQKK